MKTLILFSLLTLFSMTGHAQDLVQPALNQPISMPDLERIPTIDAVSENAHVRVVAKGVVCSFCAQGLKKAFENAPEIEAITFDTTFNFFELIFKPGQSLSDETITQKVEDAGFKVSKMIRSKK